MTGRAPATPPSPAPGDPLPRVALVVPDFQLERALAAECGAGCVAGVDEAKEELLTAAARERLLPLIAQHAVATGVGQASAATIDRLGILPATRLAMGEAIRALSPSAAAVLIDGPIRLAAVALPQRPVIRGDQLSVSIAAASILPGAPPDLCASGGEERGNRRLRRFHRLEEVICGFFFLDN